LVLISEIVVLFLDGEQDMFILAGLKEALAELLFINGFSSTESTTIEGCGS
jgi:hypothetical protein